VVLSKEVCSILQHFRVTIVGAKEKRQAKRLRLTNHFFKCFIKFMTLEHQWATGEKKIEYEDKLRIQERELLHDMVLMGEAGIDAMKKRIEQYTLCKLMDKDEEVL